MSHLLILARGDDRAYRSADGGSLLDGLSFDVTLFADHGNGYALRALEGEHEVVLVHWGDEPGIVRRAVQLHTGVPFTSVAASDERLAGLAGQIRAALDLPGHPDNATGPAAGLH
jgi:hypothetical protein